MRRRIFYAAGLLLCLILLNSCTTYYMTSDSLKDQLGKIDQQNVQKVYDFRLGILPGLLRGRQFYNGISEIQCLDKYNYPTFVKVNPSTSIRITELNGKHLTLYFDTIFSIKDSVVVGNKSHFINIPGRPIPFDSIAKIQIQSNY